MVFTEENFYRTGGLVMYVIMTFCVCVFAMTSENVDFFHWFVSDVDTEFWVGVQNDQDGLGFLEF